jgi:hypothetical protein
MDVCRQQEPSFKDTGGGHWVACWLYEGEAEAPSLGPVF